jgi:hypothetical protein
MENTILKQFLKICPNFELFNEINNDRNFDDIEYIHILAFLDTCKQTIFEYNGGYMAFAELVDQLRYDKTALTFLEGLDLLELFRKNKISIIEAFLLNSDDLIFDIVKDQFASVSKDRHVTMLAPKFCKRFSMVVSDVEERSELTSSFIQSGTILAKNNCKTYKYISNFINNGLTVEEFGILDSGY